MEEIDWKRTANWNWIRRQLHLIIEINVALWFFETNEIYWTLCIVMGGIEVNDLRINKRDK